VAYQWLIHPRGGGCETLPPPASSRRLHPSAGARPPGSAGVSPASSREWAAGPAFLAEHRRASRTEPVAGRRGRGECGPARRRRSQGARCSTLVLNQGYLFCGRL
jgi:hypothetical protein